MTSLVLTVLLLGSSRQFPRSSGRVQPDDGQELWRLLVRSSDAHGGMRRFTLRAVAITVAELVAVPFLNIRFHAGADGGGRLVTWAHTSDLPNATEWLAPGELLMSNGLNLPEERRGTDGFPGRARVRRAQRAGGRRRHARALRSLRRSSSAPRSWPSRVLAIPRDVPFVAVSRAVANANSDEEHKRLVQTVQLYEALRGAVVHGALRRGAAARAGPSARLPPAAARRRYGAAGRWRLEPEPPRGLADRLVAELRGRQGMFPAVLRVELERHERVRPSRPHQAPYGACGAA